VGTPINPAVFPAPAPLRRVPVSRLPLTQRPLPTSRFSLTSTRFPLPAYPAPASWACFLPFLCSCLYINK
jgi:hypothetical protein